VPGPQFALAEFELYHSRPIAPTRRLALGLQYLPASPVPGPGGLLLAGIVARFAHGLDEDDVDDVIVLMAQLEAGSRIVQPRLRHRLQRDRVGLLRSHHELRAGDDGPVFALTTHLGSPLVNVLGAAYAAANLPHATQEGVFAALRRALRWQGELDSSFVFHMSGASERAGWLLTNADPVAWALDVLGFPADEHPSDRQVRRRFRDALRLAHPDHGGAAGDAADRIADLAEARRILLGS
jgi:hypothetical protein